jgi:magnesium transporter
MVSLERGIARALDSPSHPIRRVRAFPFWAFKEYNPFVDHCRGHFGIFFGVAPSTDGGSPLIRSIFRTAAGEFIDEIKIDQFRELSVRGDGLLWVDFQATPPEEDEPILRESFGFHPLAIDDALQESHMPKVDDWGEYLYLVLHSIEFNRRENYRVETVELDIFIGRNFIVTHHDQPVAAIDHVLRMSRRDERYVQNGTDHLLYRIVDHLVAEYMPIVEEIDEAIEDLEDRIFDRPSNENLLELFDLKRSLLHLRRVIGPQREVLNRLARDEYAVIDAKDRIFFRDVYDHLVRLHDINESMRDLVSGAMDTYLSVVNNRMNDIMKTLTVITTLFMPLTFVVGFFGMNYFAPVAKPLEDATSLASFFIMVAVMLLLPMVMLLWMRNRKWM